MTFQPGVGISGRAAQNLISEKGLEDINKEFSEISDFSLIVEDANGVPVAQPPKDRPVEVILLCELLLYPLPFSTSLRIFPTSIRCRNYAQISRLYSKSRGNMTIR